MKRRRRILTIAGVRRPLVAVIVSVARLRPHQDDHNGNPSATPTALPSPRLRRRATCPPWPALSIRRQRGAPTSSTRVAGTRPPSRPKRAADRKVPDRPGEHQRQHVTNQFHIGLRLSTTIPLARHSFRRPSWSGAVLQTTLQMPSAAHPPDLAVLQCGDPKGGRHRRPGLWFANIPHRPLTRRTIRSCCSRSSIRGPPCHGHSRCPTQRQPFFLVYGDSQLPPPTPTPLRHDSRTGGLPPWTRSPRPESPVA